MNVIQKENLSDHFKIVEQKVKINPKRSKYILNLGSGVTLGDQSEDKEGRAFMKIDNITGFGIVHLDFRLPRLYKAHTAVATLPENAPLPSDLMEVQVTPSGAMVYLNPGSREILVTSGFSSGVRYIANLVGFFDV